MRTCKDIRTDQSAYCRACQQVNDEVAWHAKYPKLTHSCSHWRKVQNETLKARREQRVA